MTDTTGYTDAIFGMFHLLGDQFSLRIADVGGACVWRADPRANCGALDELAANKIALRLIAEHWDDLLRLPCPTPSLVASSGRCVNPRIVGLDEA